MKPDTLEVDDMPYKILALKNFCIGQFGYPNFMGEIKGIKLLILSLMMGLIT
jgi:hypothetical protein